MDSKPGSGDNDGEGGARHPVRGRLNASGVSLRSFSLRGKGIGKMGKMRSSRNLQEPDSSRNSMPNIRSSSEFKPTILSQDSQASAHNVTADPPGDTKAPVDQHVSPANSIALLPFHEIGARMKAALKSRRQGGKAAELKSKQRLSRRIRNSDPNIQTVLSSSEIARGDGPNNEKSSPMGYMHLRATLSHAHLLPGQASDSRIAENNILATKLLEMARKDNICDIQLTGKGNIEVMAPGFLLACHSPVLEEMLFPKEKINETCDTPLPSFDGMLVQSDPKKIHIKFAAQSTLKGAIHFFASLELPPDIENEISEANIRTISQLHTLAHLLKIPSLSNATYQTARRAINKNPSLACAAFDECNMLLTKPESENNMGRQSFKDIRGYALDFLRQSPPNAGVMFFSSTSIEAIISDDDMDVNEYNMWHILNLWVNKAPGTEDDKIATARSLVSHIQLHCIDPMQLNYQIKKCGYVSEASIKEALEKIDLMLENESPDDKERVIVEGAGDDRVNGVYVLHDDDIGLNSNDVIYLKEGAEGGDSCSDFGLYRWGEVWGISNCTDYFNTLYSCEISRRKGHTLRKPPKWGWKCGGGSNPAPICTWKPSIEQRNEDATKMGIAPALKSINKEKNSRASFGHALNESITFSQMMALPEDIGSNEDSYRYASAAKDLDAMMNLAVDEGHDDEEAGYNVNYLSSTLFYDPTAQLTKDKIEE
mmetsp:Transcript_13746/g.33266  ORF Transcript_13746/g.33266 Transcript_13746/m.33266 type:complete len:711 (+) Transcript_13746:145-2277(+)|eukprot:CAMPEP_0181141026 /NCGR_PEP_ID=MMETSP1071-20121207/35610_1 /TAXON_ID=35127 /ORGANISM="Thalassiosira sp., Strain NH16" /LENGTH=710 /DNA_ID=CAMNT_0023228001 /DNA_START=70 /DNA_END=2202 /DNA_ORIENTATION=+